MHASKFVAAALLGAGLLILLGTAGDALVFGQTQPNHHCCIPAKLRPPFNPEDCVLRGQNCVTEDCQGQTSQIVVPGKCHPKAKRHCDEGVGVFKVQNYLLGCVLQNNKGKLSCACVLTANGPPVAIQVNTCSGDSGPCP